VGDADGGLDRRHHTPLLGTGRLTADLSEHVLDVFTYFSSFEPRGCLILFSGQHRDAVGLRDKAVKLAQLTALNVFAPLMDKNDFPKWRYNRAGVILRKRIQRRKRWTGPLVQNLVDWTRDWMGGTSLPIYVFGHSAGGQLLSRVCAYSPLTGVKRIIICNPSAYVAPTAAKPVPFGYHGMFDERETEERIQAYLAEPITIYLGEQDTGEYQLAKGEQAMSQGANRLDRGRRIFRMANELAEQRKWIFSWSLVETPGVGHSIKDMLEASECLDALQITPARYK
jgi:hypothetical protein